MPDARCIPQPRVRIVSKARKRIHHRFTGNTGIPCAMVLTAAPCSPWCTGLVSHHRPWKLLSTNLTPASGCQDHTASPSVSVLLVWQYSHVHRIPPHVCDVGQRPSYRDRIGESLEVICPTCQAEYFFRRGWTNRFPLLPIFRSDLPVAQNHRSASCSCSPLR